MKKLFLTLAAAFGAMTLEAAPCDTISLAGMWRFQLDPMSFGKTPRIRTVSDKTYGDNPPAGINR